MGIDDKLQRMISQREAHKLTGEENYRQQSRKRLQKAMETKINTTMIGAISAVEQKLGFLWGQGKPTADLNDSELAMLALKDELRTEILNNGNNQKRAAVAEISQYEIEWKRHHMDLHVAERRRAEESDQDQEDGR